MLNELKLENFRNFSGASLSFQSRSVIFRGANGQGKTSLLESIFFIANLRSFRTSQTREIKKLSGRMRIAMTGTPIEDDLTNLWSLFDFLNKGLMGTSKEFQDFSKNLKEHPSQYGKLKSMIAPFMLRRVKTDKSIIADLPEKLETLDYADLSKKQAVLYRKTVADMEERILNSEGMERRGVVLATIMKLKQICNHPDQYLGQQTFSPSDSGKFALLREICETIYEKRERVLVFTQFREIAEYLAAYLQEIFHTGGFVLHGGTPAAKRTKIVEAFQGDRYVPFIVLSVKAESLGEARELLRNYYDATEDKFLKLKTRLRIVSVEEMMELIYDFFRTEKFPYLPFRGLIWECFPACYCGNCSSAPQRKVFF